MALGAGTNLGPYEITSLLGKGGMGEVYRAKDTKLKRDVAIKILPDEFSSEPEWISRFQREAQVLAALNHQNIASIYALQQSGAMRFLILELVEGETLADKLRLGALPLDDALCIGREICQAMEAAHEKGILHRDLKPANVKVDPQGKVKVLDFGLAKVFARDAGEDSSNSPTISFGASNAGVILGTASYMSPEQARGKHMDRRTDVWAFGCVLYEMLTGKKAFHGEDVTEILASVVKTDPDWQALPPDTPANIRTLLLRCLQKDVRKRVRDAGDIAIELEQALSAPSTAIDAAPIKSARWTRSFSMALAGLLIGALIGGVAVWRAKAPSPVSLARVTITLPLSQKLAGLNMTSIAFSPDGKRLVFVGRAGGDQQLYTRELDSWQPKLLPGTEGAISPFFSPDGQWVAFFTMTKLKKIPIAGGPTDNIADVSNPRGGSWGSDGNIVFSAKLNSGLSVVSSNGGTVRTLTTLDPRSAGSSHRFPHHIPNTGAVLFTVGTGGSWDDARIEVVQVGSGERKMLFEGGSDARYIRTGHLVYLRAGTLMAARFDLQRLEISGTPMALVEGVLTSTDNTGAPQAAVSEAGSLVYVSGDRKALDRTLAWVDRKGIEELTPLPPHFYRFPRISPDGKRVVLDIDEGNNSDIWLFDLLRGTLTRRTFDGTNLFAAWTPDGKRIAFQTTGNKAGQKGIAWATADGADTGELLAANDNNPGLGTWTPDGDTLIYHEFAPSRGRDIWTLSLKDGRRPRPLLQTAFNENNPVFAPDGRWIAYESDESGRYEIYVQPFHGQGGKILVSTEGGIQPVWSTDGHELFYRNGDKMMAVPITLQPNFHPSKPGLLFEKPYLSVPFYPRSYDVAPDGRRFLMIKENDQVAAATVLNVVLNWFEELKQKLPVN